LAKRIVDGEIDKFFETGVALQKFTLANNENILMHVLYERNDISRIATALQKERGLISSLVNYCFKNQKYKLLDEVASKLDEDSLIKLIKEFYIFCWTETDLKFLLNIMEKVKVDTVDDGLEDDDIKKEYGRLDAKSKAYAAIEKFLYDDNFNKNTLLETYIMDNGFYADVIDRLTAMWVIDSKGNSNIRSAPSYFIAKSAMGSFIDMDDRASIEMFCQVIIDHIVSGNVESRIVKDLMYSIDDAVQKGHIDVVLKVLEDTKDISALDLSFLGVRIPAYAYKIFPKLTDKLHYLEKHCPVKKTDLEWSGGTASDR